jgi:hypothetical protein
MNAVVLSELIGRVICLLVWLREEKAQTQGLLPPHPRSEMQDRCADKSVLPGAKPAPTLAVPLVSPPTSPTSSARHAPFWRFGTEAFSKPVAVFGESEWSSCSITTRQRNEKFEDSIADCAD